MDDMTSSSSDSGETSSEESDAEFETTSNSVDASKIKLKKPVPGSKIANMTNIIESQVSLKICLVSTLIFNFLVIEKYVSDILPKEPRTC